MADRSTLRNIGGGGGGVTNPSLPLNSIQFNSNGSFSGDSNLLFKGATQSVTLGTRTGTEGLYSFSNGINNVASGNYSHSEGFCGQATGFASHVEGGLTVQINDPGNIQNYFTGNQFNIAAGDASHAEGGGTCASGDGSHAEGLETLASGPFSHAQGIATSATSIASFAGGYGSIACADYAFAFGYTVSAVTQGSFAGGLCSIASGTSSFAFGTCGNYQFNGNRCPTCVTGNYSVAMGAALKVNGNSSFGFGYGLGVNGNNNFGFGYWGCAIGDDNTIFHGGDAGTICGDCNFLVGQGLIGELGKPNNGSILINVGINPGICVRGNCSIAITGNGNIGNGRLLTDFGAMFGGATNRLCCANDYSTIIGGYNNILSSGNTGATLIGGENITVGVDNYKSNVIVPNLAIWATPTTDNATDDVLVYDQTSNKVGRTSKAGISDCRLKVNLEPLENSLCGIIELQPYQFNYDTNKIPDWTKHYGLLAQDVEKIFPHVVKQNHRLDDDKNDDTLYKTIDYKELVPVLFNAIKEMNFKINQLENEIMILKNK